MATDLSRLFTVDGRLAVVVGGASGLGRASAAGLAAHGAEVVVADKDLAGAESAATELGARARSLDVGSAADIARAAEEEAEAEILVVTPGINVRKRLADTTDEEFDRVIDVNLRGTFRLIREFGARMHERGRGSIIVFSSFRAQFVEPGQGVYAATKAGVAQLARAAAAEFGPGGVRVNAVAPGPFETPLTEQIKDDPEWYSAYADKTALRRWGKPEEIVGTVLYLASDAGSYVTGGLHYVEGGWTAIDGRFEPRL
ncbi:SDR family NAD(P)-dependent oxidoreductase [Sciscionella marina]|uniref:SDR family NAD(P)-dependent oxidoreductase n=1 Tax=Sciscionella marina TaxID=508770 RepID=UPI000375482B|nr:SDR family oxidoreductase [Sciscionella marina]